ncbi:MAG: NIPSNAP family protein [Kofleriaceae bacterium]|nr:NIPSNAP family protein [Kofleriaceae bacterium]
MNLLCNIEYQIDVFKLELFRQYAEQWAAIIPRLGGDLLGYYLPYEGSSDIAHGLVAFTSLAEYEVYRHRLREDAEARTNFLFAQDNRLIVRERRNFLSGVQATLCKETR